jgi:hypothetical protein
MHNDVQNAAEVDCPRSTPCCVAPSWLSSGGSRNRACLPPAWTLVSAHTWQSLSRALQQAPALHSNPCKRKRMPYHDQEPIYHLIVRETSAASQVHKCLPNIHMNQPSPGSRTAMVHLEQPMSCAIKTTPAHEATCSCETNCSRSPGGFHATHGETKQVQAEGGVAFAT